MSSRTVHVGPRAVAIDAEPGASLLDVLRGPLGLRSVSRGCQDGSCGACRVLIDGALLSSCRAAWSDVNDGASVETFELLASDPAAMTAVRAFEAERPTRCKLCVGALGVTAVAIARSDAPRKEAIEKALEGATCLCTGRGSWRRALSK